MTSRVNPFTTKKISDPDSKWVMHNYRRRRDMPLGRYLGSQTHSYEDYDPKKVLSLEMISLDIPGKGLGMAYSIF